MSQRIPTALRAYITAVVLAATVPLVWALWATASHPPHAALLLLAAVSVLSGPLAIRIHSMRATISVCEGFIFAAGLLFGPAAATLIAVLDGLMVSLWSRDRRLYRTLFNVAEPAVSVSISVLLFYGLAGVQPLLNHSVAFTPLIVPLVVLTISYFALNTLFMAGAIWLETGTPPLRLLREHFSHVILDFCVSLSLAAVMVQISGNLTLAAVVVLAPMLIASYLSSHYVAGRLEDTNRHLAELRRLHEATIETLAMAIDAKDQVTHGHIRRVQSLSTRLALVMGASEAEQHALEAAALLHDLGKLAIPEHILNKPGPLTTAEFSQMQEHAQIGASILSCIEFPYPVAPIVRHHHENWDGTGYPAGLRGDAIPLGARILAVVDCYDALTSDRPYRKRMSENDAVEIIASRSGKMYDPAVVEAFLSVYHAVPPEMDLVDAIGEQVLESLRLGVPIDHAPRAPLHRHLPDRAAAVRAAYDRLHDPALREVAATTCRLVWEAMPDSTVGLYRYDEGVDLLINCNPHPDFHDVVPARVRLGQGITGWVGANRRPMNNSDAALDLGDDVSNHPPLRLCASAPIVKDSSLVGVLSVYSPYAFSEGNCLFLETLARELADVLPDAARRSGERTYQAAFVAAGSSTIN